jgi:hypothetical protein
MKKISLNEMQGISGGATLQQMCFGIGLMTVFSIQSPYSLYILSPAIKYCWNH